MHGISLGITANSEELIFSDDFNRSEIGDNWTTGTGCEEDTIVIIDGRIRATANCNYIRTVRDFSGNLRIEFDVEKEGTSDHDCWDFAVDLKALYNYWGGVRFDYNNVDSVGIVEIDQGCADSSKEMHLTKEGSIFLG